MPDILKVTTPLINKNQPISPKQAVEPAAAFNIQDTARVIRTHNQSELLKHNTATLEGSDTSKLLMSLLKDPAVTVTYLKNIFLLEETYRLLPANNRTVTQEIEQVFGELLVSPEDLAAEMLRQEQESTRFKGELFDLLRDLSSGGRDNAELQGAIASLLKSINNIEAQSDIIDAVSNNLLYLKGNLPVAHSLAGRLEKLLNRFSSGEAASDFQSLKAETLYLMKEIEGSFYFSPKFSKIVSIITYNLSRFNDNIEFFEESSQRIKKYFAEPEKSKYAKALAEFREKHLSGYGKNPSDVDSKVMSALIKLVANQAAKSGNESEAAKTKAILHSLLSSPCNFTPLLHFILPMVGVCRRAFAEIWISQEPDPQNSGGGETALRFLLVIDVESAGRFEAEFFVHNKIIDFTLYTPPACEDGYKAVIDSLPDIVSKTEYRVGKRTLASLERTRSLMEVFKSLPYKRVGVDVKV